MMIDLPPNLPPQAEYVMLMDASQNASNKRLKVVDLKTKTVVLETTVAHGAGSDRNKDGYAESFSNTQDSHQTSLGLYRVAEEYTGQYGTSYRLDGLDKTNSNARQRAVVLHPAPYVTDRGAGRSWGCPAISFDALKTLKTKGVLNAQTYLVIYTPSTQTNWTAYKPTPIIKEHIWTTTPSLQTKISYVPLHKEIMHHLAML